MLTAAVLSRNYALLAYLLRLRCWSRTFLDQEELRGSRPASLALALQDCAQLELLLDAGAHKPADYVRSMWHCRRLLYIGRKAQNAECFLSRLPLDVIQLIDRNLSVRRTMHSDPEAVARVVAARSAAGYPREGIWTHYCMLTSRDPSFTESSLRARTMQLSESISVAPA